jgi:hypothetical protein
VRGYAASELAVEKASSIGARMSPIRRSTLGPITRPPTPISTAHSSASET